ncbi:MAG: sulfotransferase [Jaaginema sp. PMC 1079.18]|nr:sulfotransferase [Jaaginema sp. PMC 1080.18]MEC4851925.1 sulfotransferase [Jaaginema sp. PMC 1079.18]MEC4865552.1 sulfotransferase [Jaaginema sp. PMC 1078.18]
MLVQNIRQKIVNRWQNLQRLYHQKTAKVHPQPLLILGHQKSGTTVIAALLGKVAQQGVTIDPFHQFDLNAALRQKLYGNDLSLKRVIEQHPYYFSTPIIKDPNFTFLYEPLKECFPQSQYLFVMRDPRDTIRSILNRLKIPGNLSQLTPEYQNKLRNLSGRGWYFMLQGQLPQVSGETYIQRLAQRWLVCAEVYQKHEQVLQLVRYEDFNQNKVETIRNLAKSLGFSTVGDITQAVNKQYQPKGDRAITWLDFFGQDNLAQIENICGEKMLDFQYLLQQR